MPTSVYQNRHPILRISFVLTVHLPAYAGGKKLRGNSVKNYITHSKYKTMVEKYEIDKLNNNGALTVRGFHAFGIKSKIFH